ncbi:hypothetical protein ACFXI8_15710 [Streptomyces niveus]|uniref:hypothetical protein n=1 Tax=Streptomyces niveus TaxID=193462 RepID=UPI0036A66376
MAQRMVQDRVRLSSVFTDLEREWATWQPTDPDSPGRIDASRILVYGLVPEVDKGAIVHLCPGCDREFTTERGRDTHQRQKQPED